MLKSNKSITTEELMKTGMERFEAAGLPKEQFGAEYVEVTGKYCARNGISTGYIVLGLIGIVSGIVGKIFARQDLKNDCERIANKTR